MAGRSPALLYLEHWDWLGASRSYIWNLQFCEYAEYTSVHCSRSPCDGESSATVAADRTIVRDGEPWFVAKDVADVLGYANPQKAIREHCKGVNETVIPSAGGPQMMNLTIAWLQISSMTRREPVVVDTIVASRVGSTKRIRILSAPANNQNRYPR